MTNSLHWYIDMQDNAIKGIGIHNIICLQYISGGKGISWINENIRLCWAEKETFKKCICICFILFALLFKLWTEAYTFTLGLQIDSLTDSLTYSYKVSNSKSPDQRTFVVVSITFHQQGWNYEQDGYVQIGFPHKLRLLTIQSFCTLYRKVR